jgi:micrococcal nuclease
MIDSTLKNFETVILIITVFLNSYGLNLYTIPENKVTKVIDGDTVEVFFNEKINKVRLIGLNTPESVDMNRRVECYGFEASDKLKELAHGKIVDLVPDETQDDKDKFGRYLRYLYLNGENINKKMISEGFGFEYTYKKPYIYQKDFKEAESLAKKNNLGLWNKNNCEF